MGGLLGYDSSNVRRSLNVPSSNGVSPTLAAAVLSKGRERGKGEMRKPYLDQI